MGKSTISMAIFNSYVSLPEGSSYVYLLDDRTRINQPLTEFTSKNLPKKTPKTYRKNTARHQVNCHQNLQKPTEKTRQNTKSTAIYLPVSHFNIFNKSPLSDPPPSHRDAVPSATAVWDVSVATPGPPFRRTSSADAAPEP